MRGLILDELFIGAVVRRCVSVVGTYVLYRVCSLSEDVGIVGICPLGGGVVIDVPLSELYGVPIDDVFLRAHGFVASHKEHVWLYMSSGVRLTVSLRQRHGEVFCRRVALGGVVTCWNEDIRYVHELQRWWCDRVLLSCGAVLSFDCVSRGYDVSDE